MADTPRPLPVETGANKIAVAQSALIVAAVLFFYFYQGQAAAEAAVYGGGMALFNVWLADRHVRSAARIALVAPGKEVSILYIGAVLRFVFTLVFFVVGMVWLKLSPVPLVAVFALAHLGYMFRGDGKPVSSVNSQS